MPEKPKLVSMWVLPETRQRFKVRAARAKKKLYEFADDVSKH
jgi:hypothetical protein